MNNQLDFWRTISSTLRTGERGALLCVVESTGSSPGRAGFKMFVTANAMHGSIGGGSMEHKLVELARSLLDKPEAFPFLKRQIHQPGIGQDRSGMICSGEQTIAFFLLGPDQLGLCEAIIGASNAGTATELIICAKGLFFSAGPSSTGLDEEGDWAYREPIDVQPRTVIIGAGHVGLALSRTMNQLGFHVHLMDDRAGLNTMEANNWAHQRTVVDYDAIDAVVSEDENLYVVLVSFGYRTDEVLLRQLIRKRFKYLGMLGSAEKIKTLFAAMRNDGFTEEDLSGVHAPIGLPINSRTPEEIAVSIAAEIIQVKNQ